MIRLKGSRISIAVEMWTCPVCGRKAPYYFYAHATRLGRMDYCSGKVAKTVRTLNITPLRLALATVNQVSLQEVIEEVCSN